MFLKTAILVTFSISCFAQVGELATTDDGGVVLFSSTLRLAGSTDGPQSKVFRWDESFSLVFSARAFPGGVNVGASSPVISGDGSAYGYTTLEPCLHLGCLGGPNATYVRNGVTIQQGGPARMSHNGRFALVQSPLTTGPAVTRLDFETGERLAITDSSGNTAALGITDSGKVLIKTAIGLYLGSPNQPAAILAQSDAILNAAVSADGSRVLYTVKRGDTIELRERDRLLATAAAGFGMKLSNDGNRALITEFADAQQSISWFDFQTMVRTDLGPIRDANSGATLSGDGRVVWMVEPDGHLARIALDTGERLRLGDQLVEIFAGQTSIGVRGSLDRIRGSFGTTDSDLTKWHVSITGFELDRIELPVLESKDTHLDYQLPWELPTRFNRHWISIGKTGNTFEQVIGEVQVNEFIPSFWIDPASPKVDGQPVITAAHEDYRSLVTPENPGRPGELLHVYLTGLGPVTPPQKDFVPAPLDVLAATVSAVSCRFNTRNGGRQSPALVRFSGLAPGLVGIYLLEVEVPPDWTPPVSFSCQIGSWGGSGSLPIAR